MFALFLACADETPAWAVQHASISPTETGFTGTQTWEFFREGWTPESGSDAYLCARAQTSTGAVTTLDTCDDCRAAYTLTVEELGSDCPDSLVKDPAFAGPDAYAITEVPSEFAESNPYPSQSFGWQVVYGSAGLTPLGWAYAESLDTEQEPGAPGWTSGRVYILWPGVAWEL